MISSGATLFPAFKAKFAPVVPLGVQKQLTDEGIMGDYHLLLAHLILENPTEWQQYYIDNPDCFVIMDNSLIELGKALPSAQILAAAQLVRAKALILPDFLLETEKTIEASVAGARSIGWLPSGMKYLGVVQGTTIQEIDTCIRQFIHEIPQLGYLSIPRVVTKALGSRMPAIQRASFIMAEYGQQYPIHLLGFSDNLVDDMKCCTHPDVMGIDSAMPVWASIKPYRFSSPTMVEALNLGKRPEYFMKQTHFDDPIFDRIKFNLKRVREWMEVKTEWSQLEQSVK